MKTDMNSAIGTSHEESDSEGLIKTETIQGEFILKGMNEEVTAAEAD